MRKRIGKPSIRLKGNSLTAQPLMPNGMGGFFVAIRRW